VVRLAPLIEPKSFHRESLEVNKPENSPQRAADQAPHLQPSGVTGLSPPLLLLSDSFILIETVAGDASLFFVAFLCLRKCPNQLPHGLMHVIELFISRLHDLLPADRRPFY